MPIKDTSKTRLIIELLAQDLTPKEIMNRADCSQGLVYKTQKKYLGEIAQLKLNAGKIPTLQPEDSPSIPIPTIDMTLPVAPQLEGMAWTVIAHAAAGRDVATKQVNASRDILKHALKDKKPPPVSRRLVFKVDVIDIVNEKIEIISSKTYEVKP